MSRISQSIKNNKVASKYIGSGLLKTGLNTIASIIILRWIEPETLGVWHTFIIFVSYTSILNLGVTSGLNRELPFLIGKGENEKGIDKLKTAGYFSNILSYGLIVISSIIGLILFFLKILNLSELGMMIMSFSIGSISLQSNFLGATFRSNNSFEKLTKLQSITGLMYILLLPVIYYFGIWGYILYEFFLSLFTYLGYYYYRPYKVKYVFSFTEFKALIRIGLPMYFWNYITSISKSVPRLILVLFGNPLLVGLYAPANSINTAMLNLPMYINRYLFPKLSFLYGKNQDANAIYNYTIKVATFLFILMIVTALLLSSITPFLFKLFFPKYVESIFATQIILFSGVFYSINSLFHNSLYSLKFFKPFKYIISLRVVYIFGFAFIFNYIFNDLLMAVSLSAVASEFLNMLNYIYYLRQKR